MKSTLFFLTILLSISCAASEPNQNAAEEHLKAEIPEGWARVLNSNTGNLILAEYIPADSPDPWQQKLSIEVMSGSNLPDPLGFTAAWAQDQSELCEKFEDHPIHSGFENGYPTVVRMLVCGENKRTGKPLVTMIKVIQGNESLYTITRIWRLEELPLPQNEIAAWSSALRKTIACDPTLPAHACPTQ